ncbi:MAG: glycosyltransferase [Firmicutes bacterium]|nr:glycosyltransferase [Bacillota bacterium]
MNILILSCNTGEGHNSAAKAIAEQFMCDGHDCVIKDALAFASPKFSKFICDSYKQIVLRTPYAFGAMYKISKAVANPNMKSLVYASSMVCAKKMYDFISSYKFDAVVSTHLFAAQAMTHIKNRYKLSLPSYIVSTDYGFCPFFEELDVERYFIPMEMLRSDFLRRGVSSDKIVVSGIPVAKRFMQLMDKAQARERLGVSMDCHMCIIMSGSMGYGDIYNMLDGVVANMPQNTRIFVLAGNNDKLLNGVNNRYSSSVVRAIGFTNEVNVYMAAADVLVTKPGGLTSTEAMVSNVPLVLAKPIPGCESENYLLLTGIGAAKGGKKAADAAENICLLLSNENERRKVIDRQNEYICKRSAEIICDTIARIDKDA